MRRLTTLGILGSTVLVAFSIMSPASAVDRVDVELVNDQSFVGGDNPFWLNVPGCSYGLAVDVSAKAKPGPGTGVFHGIRRFECAGDAGSVTVDVAARFGADGSVGTWAIVDATGVLAGAHGAGTLVGYPLVDGIRDVYTGTVTVTG